MPASQTSSAVRNEFGKRIATSKRGFRRIALTTALSIGLPALAAAAPIQIDTAALVARADVDYDRPASRSDLKAGRNVLVVGTVANGTRTVRLAVILPAVARPPAGSVPPPSPAPSASRT